MFKYLIAIVFLLFTPFVYAQQSFATAAADTITVLTNTNATLTSQHFIFLFNNSSTVTPYNYSFSLCSQGFVDCTVKSFTVNMQPHVSMAIYWNLTLNVLYTTMGNYKITATTTLTGPGENIVANGNSVIQVLVPN